jgi:hypothetical protein
MSKKPSEAYIKVFQSAPQLNPGNSGKGPNGSYKRSYNKTQQAKRER